MSEKWKRLLTRLFIILNLLLLISYLLVTLVPFLSPADFWVISVLGLGFPFLLCIVVLFMIVLIIMKSRWAIVSALALLLSWQQVSAMLALRFGHSFDPDKKDDVIRVMSWNVNRWDEDYKQARGGASYRSLMLDFVQIQDADILCFQEFFDSHLPQYNEPNMPPLEKMGYPYHCFLVTSNEVDGNFQHGMIIFSRFPIIDSAKSTLGATEHPEGLCYADIRYKDQMIRIFNTHLQSVRFDKKDYANLDRKENLPSLLRKVKNSYGPRSLKAERVREFIKASPYPSILCADLDDVPNSYAYFKVKGTLNDVFLKKGFGLGATVPAISPTLRIDYIFADRKFHVAQFARLKNPYSDHYPLVVDLSLK